MLEVVIKLKDILSLVLPIVLLAASIIITWSILKWGTKLNMGVKYIFKNPFFVVFWILIFLFFMYAYFEYIKPLFTS